MARTTWTHTQTYIFYGYINQKCLIYSIAFTHAVKKNIFIVSF